MSGYKPDYYLDSEHRMVVVKDFDTDEIVLKYITSFIPVMGQKISIQSKNSDTAAIYVVEIITDVITTGDGWVKIETHVKAAKLSSYSDIAEM